MADDLRLDPERVRTGGRDLTSAGRQLAAQRSTTGEELASRSAGRPWGTDDIGQAFERNYRPVEQQALQVWQQLAAYAESLGSAVVETVDETTATDRHAAAQVERSSRKLP